MQLTLFRNYLRSAIRNLLRNRVFSAINIFGLAISLSVGLLIVSFVNELNGYDDFQKKGQRIFRITNTYQYLDEDPDLFASTSILAGTRVRDEVAGLEEVVLMHRNFSDDFGSNEPNIPLSGYYVSEGFFKVFSFKLIEGNIETALKDPYKIVLTKKAAEKLYGRTSNLVGEVLQTTNDKQFTVSGLMENPPFNSHMQFEIIGSFSTKELKEKDNERWLRWNNMWSNYAYLLFDEGISEEDIQKSLDQISKEENAKEEVRAITLGLQNIRKITPGPDMSNQLGKTAPSMIPLVLSIFALIVIISACFNYTNLSIARSLRRAKEVGVRKVIGSSSSQVFYQFILEAIIVSLLALILALGLFFLLRPAFLTLDNEVGEMVTLTLNYKIILQFIILAIITGFIAGLLPAFLFAKISPNNVLRNTISLSKFKGITLRKTLIVIQFTLSVMFILAAVIEYKQFKYAMNFDLGYQTDNILNIQLQGNKPEVLRNEINKIPEVEEVSSSLMVTSVGSYWSDTMKYKDPMDSVDVYYNGVDEHYIPLHGHKLLAGNNFTPLSNDTSSRQVIVNEELLKYFNIGTPEESIGEVLKMDDKEAIITGVIKNFHYGTLSHELKPFLFLYKKEGLYRLNVKLLPNANLITARTKIETAWKSIDNVHPFEATFYNERIEDAYDQFSVMVKIVGVLAFLAITIAALGLLGMVMFTTETRLKEISIRKVLGASENSLVFLLGRSFLYLLLLSSVIAVPLTIIFFKEVLLNDVAYHADISLSDTLSGPSLVILVGVLTTGIITFFAARSNPASILRNE